MVYPVPDPRYPFLGVHFTRRVSGGARGWPQRGARVSAGGLPASATSGSADVRDTRRRGPASGAWPVGTGAQASRRCAAHSRSSAYMRTAQPLCARDRRGRRRPRRLPACAPRRSIETASLVDDFRINDNDGIVTIRNAPSPAATSSLAIAGIRPRPHWIRSLTPAGVIGDGSDPVCAPWCAPPGIRTLEPVMAGNGR